MLPCGWDTRGRQLARNLAEDARPVVGRGLGGTGAPSGTTGYRYARAPQRQSWANAASVQTGRPSSPARRASIVSTVMTRSTSINASAVGSRSVSASPGAWIRPRRARRSCALSTGVGGDSGSDEGLPTRGTVDPARPLDEIRTVQHHLAGSAAGSDGPAAAALPSSGVRRLRSGTRCIISLCDPRIRCATGDRTGERRGHCRTWRPAPRQQARERSLGGGQTAGADEARSDATLERGDSARLRAAARVRGTARGTFPVECDRVKSFRISGAQDHGAANRRCGVPGRGEILFRVTRLCYSTRGARLK